MTRKNNSVIRLVIFTFIPLLCGCFSSEDDPDNKTTCIKTDQDSVTVETLSSGVSITKSKDICYYEGDIVLTLEQLIYLAGYGELYQPGTQATKATDLVPITNLPKDKSALAQYAAYTPRNYNLWAMARFTYDNNLSSSQRDIIKKALLNIQSKTNVRFYNATGLPTRDNTYNIDYPYINFRYCGPQDRCSSKVGKTGEKQDINLADFAFSKPGVVEHEICHALGLLHEQCRPDRDDYVTINTSNLTTIGKANFQKRASNYSVKGPYDFNSIMGNSSYTSSANVVIDALKPIYTKQDGSVINQGIDLSDGDCAWLNYYYLPYVARSDDYVELDSVVYDGNNKRLTEEQRLQLQSQLNNGNPTPPSSGRISNNF